MIKRYCFRLRAIIAFAFMSVLSLSGIKAYCAEFPVLPESEPVWKNVPVMGKRMSVYCIFMDSRGIVWAGTNNGLFFYDGVSAHPAGGTDMIRNQVYSIIEMDDGLLLGTNTGLMTFTYKTGSISLYSDDTPKEIRSILLDGDILWIGSIYGMYIADLVTGEIRNVSEGLPHKSVYSILKDSRGTLYAGTYNGLARWDRSAGIFRKTDVPESGGNVGNLFVNCLLETADHCNVYIGTEGNLYRFNRVKNAFETNHHVRGHNVKSLAESSDGHLLVGTDKGIFDICESDVRQYVHDSRQEFSLANNEIWCILADDRNNILAGHEVGLSITSGSDAMRAVRLSSITHSGEGNDIHVIYRDSRDILWMGGTNGVIRLAGNGRVKCYYTSGEAHSLSHNHIRSIREDSDGNIWFATDGGLNRYNASADGFDVFRIVDKEGKHAANWVYAIEEDGDDLLVGSYLGGLHRVAKDRLNSVRGGVIISDESANDTSPMFKGSNLNLNSSLVNNVIKDAAGNVWILCFGSRILTELMLDGTVKSYDIKDMSGNHPVYIASDRYGRIWCAFNGGAVVFNCDDSYDIIRFPKTDSDESILSVAGVGKDVWISTVSNMWSIDGETLEVRLLPIPQKSYKSIYADSATGKVYLGGNDEITEIVPDKLGDSAGKPAIRMVLAGVGDGNFDLSMLTPGEDGLTLPHGGNLTLVVSNLDYSPDASKRYVYKLAKARADTAVRWIIMPEDYNIISLSEMKMGDYFLLLRTVGSPAPAYSLPLRVSAPPALSWWAFCLYFAALAAIVAYIIFEMYRRNVRILQEEERKKSLKNAERKLAFLTGISHDLKTPLSMIMGPASVLRGKTSDKEIQQGLGLIYDNAVKLNNMIHRTLEMNYLDVEDEDSMIISVFDAVNLCRSIFEAFEANNRQKKFIFHSAETQLLIETDAVKFESVMTNLLSNACKYSDDNATISCGISRDGQNVRIAVSDDGIGIDKTDQSLVFQRMFRAPSSSGTHEGTGIGLYLVKRYIELMKGTVDLYSERGQGTSFIITLPLSDRPVSAEKEPVADDNGGKKPKILIVEDNPQISEFINSLLKKEYTCLSAENGRSGLSIAASFVPDLIISDELMPVMNGMEMISRLKQNVRLSNIPVIMLTAKSDNDTETKSVRAGVDIFMPKPFEPSVLTGRVKHLIELREKMQESIRIGAITEVKPIEAESVSEKQLALISKVIEDNVSDPDLNVNWLCEKCGMSNKQLYRIIKKYTGVGPLDYIRNVRLQKAAMLLGQKRFTVAEICYMTGFKTPSYFAKCFYDHYGVKPSQYRSDI